MFRRHVRIGEITFIGKESNKLEEVDAGLIHSGRKRLYRISRCQARLLGKRSKTQLEGIPRPFLMRRNRLVSKNADKGS